MKKMGNKMATADDDVPCDVLKTAGRWSQTNDTTDQQHIQNLRVAQGFHCIYSNCLKDKVKSYKVQQPSHNHPYCTYTKDSSDDI
jgi:hypothetical protein